MTSNSCTTLCIVFYLLLAPLAFALTESDALSAFQKLRGQHKAIAISGSGTHVISSTVHSQPSPALASIKALSGCEAERSALGSEIFCEIRAINDSEITPAQKIRAKVPDQHPLFLWKVVSSQATVYLAGSIHVFKQSLYPFPQQYQSAFDSSDNVVVEVDTMNVTPQELASLVKKYFLLPESQSIQNFLSEGEKALLIDYLEYRSTSIDAVSQLKPSMLAIQLSLNQLVAMGYSQEYGVEKFFLKQIESRNILHLETLEQQFYLLGSAPMPLQLELLRDSLTQIDKTDATMAALLTAWLSGDAEAFESLTQTMVSESVEYLAFSQKLIDERNVGMASRIEEYLNNKGTYFVMVGAAHLIGKHSILSLLKQQGWIATQVFSDDRIQGADDNPR